MAQRPRDVFINCPFDQAYKPLFYAITFTVIRSGFKPRSALETDDGGDVRVVKILRIIEECRYGIHDISRTELSGRPPLPRFNMPFELGLYLGARIYGRGAQKAKNTLILDRQLHRFRKFISDISGQDIHAHGGQASRAIVEVATWLRDQSKSTTVPGGKQIAKEFAKFRRLLPSVLAARRLAESEMTFGDFASLATAYIDTVA